MIVQAEKKDAKAVIALMYEAIGSAIARSLTGAEHDDEALAALEQLFAEEGNRISYRHVLVDKREGQIAGMLLSYSGDEAAELDKPLAERAMRRTGAKEYAITQEAAEGDYYLDAIAVDAAYRGQGIASALIAAFENKAALLGYSRATLIVEPDNAKARALYTRLGYKPEGEIVVSGKRFGRMVKFVLPA
ncbi:GNAT family N-acetyltransferase [Paenibacillus protaetiae]|uniref:GNAT family N-acetyltransferase n=1 Tax=Paenibacillus protaetiae TaxID=2509456 RepID=A0A4P6EUT6_9BACL|nr:GNAT family N-acetyltransferase [Paenibacillus protaetiae]QAY66724.1 GNAT family N-acetyltransferase [Paenibacillus protaetiae]